MRLDDPENPVTDTMIWALMGLGKDRTIVAHFQVPEVQITYAEITEDRINVTLQPETYSGTFQLRLTGPDGVSHTIRTEARTGGQHVETFGIANLPIAEFTAVEAWWGCAETLQTYSHHFKNLGVYRHSQYNSPHEADASCAGSPVDVRYYTSRPPECAFDSGTMSTTFRDAISLNGSGVSISHGLIQLEWDCKDVPLNQRFRPVNQIFGKCGTVSDSTVAVHRDNNDLKCNDEILIVGLGPGVGTIKSVTDNGGGVGLTQCDNFTETPITCGGVNDLGRFITIKLFE
jgi:hypothetical protein